MSHVTQQPTARRYEIVVEGGLDAAWSSWLDGLEVTQPAGLPALTRLVGAVDQAALRGILNKLWDLNLSLVAVRRLAPDADVETR